MTNLSTSNDKSIKNQQTRFDAHPSPTILLNAAGCLVVTANKKACELFGKDLAQIVGQKGGQVFDCLHAAAEGGCDKDPNCTDCMISKAIQETSRLGIPHDDVKATIEVKRDGNIAPYCMQLSTRKIEDFILITIHQFQKSLAMGLNTPRELAHS